MEIRILAQAEFRAATVVVPIGDSICFNHLIHMCLKFSFLVRMCLLVNSSFHMASKTNCNGLVLDCVWPIKLLDARDFINYFMMSITQTILTSSHLIFTFTKNHGQLVNSRYQRDYGKLYYPLFPE